MLKIKSVLLILAVLSFSSCKSIDENKQYNKITPELIDIISKYKPDNSESPVDLSKKKLNWTKQSYALVEVPINKRIESSKITNILNLNFSTVVLCLPFDKSENSVISSLQKQNNIMGMSRKDFHKWLLNAAGISKILRRNRINVMLMINLNIYRFNYRMNIPLFRSTQYKHLSQDGKDNFKEYLYKFHKYLIEKLHLSGIILQNTNFLPFHYWKEFINEIYDYTGNKFFIAFFSKGDIYIQEKFLSIGVKGILNYKFSKAVSNEFAVNGSLSKLSNYFSIDNLYKKPENHIIFASTQENYAKEQSLKSALGLFALTSPRISILHIGDEYLNKTDNLIPGINAYKKRYLKRYKKIEIFKNDDVYTYLLSDGKNDLFVLINKSNNRYIHTYFLKLNKNIPKHYIFKDISGAPPIKTNRAAVRVILSGKSGKALYYHGKNKFRNLRKINRFAVSYSSSDPNIKIIRFSYRPARRVKTIHLVGDFNNWNTRSLPMIDENQNGVYTVRVPLPRGKYTYKILINGKILVADYKATIFADDGNGGKKSVIIVR